MITYLILKWLSQVLIVASGIYGMFSNLYKEQEPGEKRELTRAGWVNMAALVTGFVLYAATDFQERQVQKVDAAFKADQSISQKRIIDTQQQLIGSQTHELNYLHHLILAQEVVDGWELSWQVPEIVMREAMSKAQSLNNKDPYLRTCLSSSAVTARAGANGHWAISCVLSRPQGVLNLTYDLSPPQPEWQVFESVLDTLLSPRFAVSQREGEDFLVLSRLERPDQVAYTWRKVVVTVRNRRVRLGRLEQPVEIVLRLDSQVAANAPAAVRIRSLDPNLQLDQTFRTGWTKRQVGTELRYSLPGEEPTQAPVYALFSGPHQLKGSINKLLFSFETNQPATH